MISCPVCAASNHHLRISCTSCGGFLQARVENLDLFPMLWKVIESPAAAFKSIALSRHKNYVTILSAFAGSGIMFLFLWYADAGDYAPSTIVLLTAGVFLGFVAGSAVIPLLALLLSSGGPLIGARIGFRNARAVLGFAFTPFMISEIFLLPLELYTFGGSFFGTNPPAVLIDPVSYYIFVALHAGSVIWSFSLTVIGVRVLTEGSRLRAMAGAACLFILLAATAVALDRWLEPEPEQPVALIGSSGLCGLTGPSRAVEPAGIANKFSYIHTHSIHKAIHLNAL